MSFVVSESERESWRAQGSRPRSDAEQAIWVALVGELDIATVPETDRALRRAEASAALVVVDLRALEFIDAGAAMLLLAADRRIKASGGRLIVVRGPAEIDCVFELIGLDRQLELVDWPAARATASFEVAPA
jgi:anti-sigma B factor antagonist